MRIILVGADQIKHGDTVICRQGHITTVNRNDIKNGFMGLTIFSYPYGNRKEQIKKVLFPVWYQGEIVRYE